MVRRLRTGAASARRGGGAARQRRRRRRNGGAGCPAGARSRPAGGRALSAVRLDVELGGGFLCRVRRVDDLELERPVVQRDDLDLVEQERALGGTEGRR